jgi:hypothetical protein
MARETTTDTALRLTTYLLKVRRRLEGSGEVDRENVIAVALYTIAITVQTAILNGKILEFAEACYHFTAAQAGKKEPQGGLSFAAPELDPSAN